MNDVFVERRWSEPLSEAAMLEIASLAATCMDLHRVSWLGTLLSSDGLDMFCHFRGPDAESVRIALRQAGAAPGCVWTCRVEDAPETTPSDLADSNVLVCHAVEAWAPSSVSGEHLDFQSESLRIEQVRLVRTYRSMDQRRCFAIYKAPAAESVHRAQREARLPPGRIWTVRRYAPRIPPAR